MLYKHFDSYYTPYQSVSLSKVIAPIIVEFLN